MITKTFTHKEQMINYYNKVKQNNKIAFCMCSLDAELGYCVRYSYR